MDTENSPRQTPIFVRAFTIADKFGIDIPSGEALNAFRVALEEGRDTFDDVGTSYHVGWSAYGIAYDKERDLQRAGAEVGKVVDFAKELKQN